MQHFENVQFEIDDGYISSLGVKQKNYMYMNMDGAYNVLFDMT